MYLIGAHQLWLHPSTSKHVLIMFCWCFVDFWAFSVNLCFTAYPLFTFLSPCVWLWTNSNNVKQCSLVENKNSRKATSSSFSTGLHIVIAPCTKINSALLSQVTGNKQKERDNVMITMITECTHTQRHSRVAFIVH